MQKANISEQLTNMLSNEELSAEAAIAKFATVENEEGRIVERDIEYYNLDVIISVGYRVKSQRGIQFRQWVTQ